MKSVLLDSSSSSALGNLTTDDSDIDFADVFGGPPRRRSFLHDVMRHSFSETAAGDGNGGALISRRSMWLGEPSEKPVFGDDPSNRRRFTTGDFFNDIFRGDGSSIGSPRNRSELDSLGSNPGSRVMSPTRPLPIKSEPYGTSLPTQFSLPAKVIKATEMPTVGSSTRSLSKNRDTASSSPLSRSSSQSNLRNGSFPKPDSDNVSEVHGRSRHFHFSIYKWPNKGVPTVLWGGSRLNAMVKATDDDEITLQQHTASSDARPTSDEKVGIHEDESRAQADDVQIKPGLLPRPSFSGGLEAREANIKPLHSFFANDRQGEDVIADEESREGKSRAKNARPSNGDAKSRKKPQGRRSSSDRTKIEKPSFPSSSSKTEEVKGDRVKGKVKEFIKVFSQGSSIGTDGESLGQSFRWRAKENTAGTDLNKTISVDEQQKPNSDPTAVEQHPSQVQDSDTQDMESGTHGVSGQERRQEQSTEHNVHEDTDEPFDLNFQVKEITQDEDKHEKSGDDADEIQIIDAKIRKWSQGKDGNIRSLLSTLQYILWPGSGWKAVPLMDMIEANAVRRSYQRALLILHPDKLQQKGASSDHKYIAERVFELLQEAWDFFNSVGAI